MFAEIDAGLCAAGGFAAWAVRGRASSVFGPSVWHGPDEKRIALTFDDGPTPGTVEILSVLTQYGVKATFFQCGANVRRHGEIACAVRDGGHEIGNHSDTHPMFALKSAAFIEDEFQRAQEAIGEACGVAPKWCRAPYGVRWFGFAGMQQRLGLKGAMWTVIGRDWKLDADAIAKRVLGSDLAGGIVCLHDGRALRETPDIGQTIEAVKRMVPALLERGYRMERISDLCGS